MEDLIEAEAVCREQAEESAESFNWEDAAKVNVVSFGVNFSTMD